MTELLDITNAAQPFDLQTALTYMKDNGEFIRCKKDETDFYMYISIQKKPVVIDGRRQFKEFRSVYGVTKFGGSITQISLADLYAEHYYIMQFDENGNPIWDDPQTKAKE